MQIISVTDLHIYIEGFGEDRNPLWIEDFKDPKSPERVARSGIKSQFDGVFTVGIKQAPTVDIKFNFLIVN